MIKSIPINDKGEQERLCRECGVAFDPEHLAYKIDIDGSFAGILAFTINGESGCICEMATKQGVNDTDALFITARGALNFLDLHGIHDAYFKSDKVTPENEILVKMIGFRKQENGEWYMNLRGFFTADTCKNSCRNI